MAVALRNAQVANSGATTPSTLAITKPTGLTTGDVMIANLGANLANTNSFSLTGWTRVPGFTVQSNGSNCMQDVLYRVADGSEGASFTFTCTATGKLAGDVAAYSGVDNANPFAGVNEKNAVASTTITFPATTPQAETVYGVLCGVTRNVTAAATMGASSGYATTADTSTTASAFVQAFIQDTHSTYGLPLAAVTAGSGTNSQSTNYSTAMIMLRADISGASGLTVDFAQAQVDAGATSHTFTLTTGYAEAIFILLSASAAVGSSGVSGASLTWANANIQNASTTREAEIWYAYSASAISAQTITISYAGSTSCNIVVVSFKNAATSPLGATAIGTALTQNLTTTAANSMVLYSMAFSGFAAVTAATSNTNVFSNGFNTGTAGMSAGRSTAVVASPSSFTAGISAPTGKTYDTAVVEVLAVVSSFSPRPNSFSRQAVNRASTY